MIKREKHTYIIDEEGHTITTDISEYSKPVPIQDAIRKGIIAMPKTKEERLKLFSETELKEMGYDIEEKDVQ